ncbi:uncharacterized protein [Procambarus clarkii]|uniref:uncharacterized protein n=1 Tax=Procambarus clarkii TaxID=6728 RepID=UPI0037420642
MEGRAVLPCDVSTTLEDDHPVLVMFYNNDSGTPIYTVDLRNRRVSQPKHQPLSVLKNRAKFDMTSGTSGLHLETVWSSDDGLYRCRVDFKKSPTRNSRIYLTVIVPPDSVRIVDVNGNEKSSTIGPYVLGMTLTLKCVATGGRPAPKLTWWAGHKEVRGEVSESPGEVLNTLTVPSLQRHHLDQSFICQATNAELAVPVTAAVTIDMTLPPMSIDLIDLDGPISAGVGVTITCIVVGARPPPNVSWWLDGRPLRSSVERHRDNRNVTESKVVVVASAEDQGRYLSCRAETPGLLQSSLEDGTKLVVHYVPVVFINFDSRLKLHDIKEGMDVHFTCNVTAVPAPTTIHWYHNENLLRANSTSGLIVTNLSLALQKVDRYSSGSYTCRATNSEGQGVSRPILLDVKYSPVCRPGQRWVYGIAREEMVHVSCEVDAHPKHVNFAWVFNNTAEYTDIPENHITENLTLSMLTYTPKTLLDYGFLLCWATNSVGKQREPCVFKIFPAGPPDALRNCTVLNESTDAVQVRCDEGFDGGLPQSFVMEVYETEGRKLKSNVTSKTPFFTVRGLPSGLALTIRIYAANAKGRSDPTVLPAATVANVQEKHISAGVYAVSGYCTQLGYMLHQATVPSRGICCIRLLYPAGVYAASGYCTQLGYMLHQATVPSWDICCIRLLYPAGVYAASGYCTQPGYMLHQVTVPSWGICCIRLLYPAGEYAASGYCTQLGYMLHQATIPNWGYMLHQVTVPSWGYMLHQATVPSWNICCIRLLYPAGVYAASGYCTQLGVYAVSGYCTQPGYMLHQVTVPSWVYMLHQATVPSRGICCIRLLYPAGVYAASGYCTQLGVYAASGYCTQPGYMLHQVTVPSRGICCIRLLYPAGVYAASGYCTQPGYMLHQVTVPSRGICCIRLLYPAGVYAASGYCTQPGYMLHQVTVPSRGICCIRLLYPAGVYAASGYCTQPGYMLHQVTVPS